MDPTRGLERATKSAGSLTVAIAPKARIRASGKASANLLAAPSRVDPRVIMSSTKRISFGGGPEIRRWTLRLAKWSLGFGLSDALLDAAFLMAQFEPDMGPLGSQFRFLPRLSQSAEEPKECLSASGNSWALEPERYLAERNRRRANCSCFLELTLLIAGTSISGGLRQKGPA